MAREVTVTGSQADKFGRIVLAFDQPTKVTVRASNGVLVIAFAEPARILAERLVSEIARYTSAVRRDPDGTGIRLALTAPVRTSVLEAGERVFIDLLPQSWTGLPPGLPPEIVAALAERARVAEAKLKAEAARPVDKPAEVKLRLAKLPTLTRFVFEPPNGTPMRIVKDGPDVSLAFDGRLVLDEAGEKPRLAPGVKAMDIAIEKTALGIRIVPATGFTAQSFQEGDTLVVDLAKPGSGKPALDLTRQGAAPKAAELKVAPQSAAPVMAEPAPSPPPRRPDPPPPPAETVAAEPPPPPVQAMLPPGQVRPRWERAEAGSSLLFPFRAPTPAAAFEREGVVTLLFDTLDTLGAADNLQAAPAGLRVESSGADGFFTVRVSGVEPGAARLALDGTGWRLWPTGGGALPPDAVAVTRAADENGRVVVAAALAGAARVHWIREPDGSRVAIATAASRVQGPGILRRFVEFDLPPTLHGVAVFARADDLVVGLGRGGVVVGREAGLSLTGLAAGAVASGDESFTVLNREGWAADRTDEALQRYQGLVSDAATAPRSGRAEARYRLARFMIANDLNHEAASVLALARSEDPVFAKRRETILLSGIAAARSGRPAEAKAFLATEALAHDPEAAVWRAYADALQGRWVPALAGLRKGADVIRGYPDELAGPIRLATLRGAIDTGDLPRAEGELASIDRLAPGSIPRDEHDFARARMDEAAGRTDAALKAYDRLMDEASLPISSAANLRGVALGFRTGALGADAAMSRLEILSVAWRGDETEIGTIVELAQHYAKAKRWRDLFAMTRRASRRFPNHELTRALYDQTAHLLENLLLGAEGEELSAVQALGLYFDFKEFAPIGRRGDEIVRRLADRLVELDLLDQAADLLQYQIDRRLAGAARATVAARLAAIRLMNGKPVQALQALHDTRFTDLPADVKRFRFLLEARAQADLSRYDLALEVLDGETGGDASRLRISILWQARRWREAGEAAEALLGTRWSGDGALADRDRADVIRAAIAYGFADERLALDRLKTKFGRKMLDSPDAQRFEALLRPGAIGTKEFRDALRETTRIDPLKELLADWRGRLVAAPPAPAEEAKPADPAAAASAARAAATRPGAESPRG